MLFFILYITVMIALKSFGEETEYLACVMLFMLLCWRPGSGDTVTDKNRGMGMYYKYKNCKEYNDSNPLYVQGCLREKSELSIFGSLKGLYICQLISLVILALAWIYLGVKHTYGQIRLIEVLLMACGFLLMIGWMGVKEYYKKRYDWASGYAEGKKGIWEPFRSVYQPYGGWQKDNDFRCHYYIRYEAMKEKLKQTTREKGYVFFKCYQEEGVKEFNSFIRLNEEALDIFALIYVERMEENSWDKFNSIFETFWKEKVAGRYETKQMAFTFLICVDEYSKELRRTIARMRSEVVGSKSGRYRLSALLDYSDHSLLYVASDYWQFRNDKRRKKIRSELLEMLDISMELNGREYPEGGHEEEIW